MVDIFSLGEALAAQSVRVEQLAETMPASERTQTIGNVLASCLELQRVARLALEKGESESVMYAMAFVDGGLRLVDGLINHPTDALVIEMSKPFC